jgi:ABC-type glycerol-3-phosphate transport system permease component
MSKQKILIVDDDNNIAELISLYLTKENLKTMAISLYTFTGPLGSQYNLICAGVIISLLPALIVFIVFQRCFTWKL